jgi:hypothetical protein
MADYNFGLTGAMNPNMFGNMGQQNNQQSSFNSGLMNIGTGVNTNPFGKQYNPNDAWSNAAYNTALGNQAGAQYATLANRVNQNTPYGSLNYTQSVDQFGNPTWTANQSLSQPLQDLTNSSLQGLQASQANPMYGINAGENYTDALMRRLQPQMTADKESFDVTMANRGIPVGSEAYNRAYRTFSQGQNDQLTSAQIGGMQTGLQAQQLQNQTAANIKSLASPNYINPYTQAAVAGPDYLGAAGLSNNNAIANQNMQNAASANLQNGLFGLAGTGLMAYGLSKGF